MKYRHGDRWKSRKVIRIARFCQSFLALLPGQRDAAPARRGGDWLAGNGNRELLSVIHGF